MSAKIRKEAMILYIWGGLLTERLESKRRNILDLYEKIKRKYTLRRQHCKVTSSSRGLALDSVYLKRVGSHYRYGTPTQVRSKRGYKKKMTAEYLTQHSTPKKDMLGSCRVSSVSMPCKSQSQVLVARTYCIAFKRGATTV